MSAMGTLMKPRLKNCKQFAAKHGEPTWHGAPAGTAQHDALIAHVDNRAATPSVHGEESGIGDAVGVSVLGDAVGSADGDFVGDTVGEKVTGQLTSLTAVQPSKNCTSNV